MRELEGRLDEVERCQDKQEDRMKEMDGRMKRVEGSVDKLAGKINDVAENSGGNVFQELHERHVRRYNVVFYGVGEAEGDRPTVEEKREWDAKSCQNVFDALNLRLKASSLRYLRRIGEKGDKPRPLLVGMRSTEDKELLLDNAKFLRDTHMSSVGISKDLTPQEIREEKEMEREAETRNKELSQEDRAKNLKWLVVGQKGEKRLIKTTEKSGPTSRHMSRGGHASRGHRSSFLPPISRGRTNSKRGLSDSGSDEERGRARHSNQRKRPNTTSDHRREEAVRREREETLPTVERVTEVEMTEATGEEEVEGRSVTESETED
jgi:hypothetical protein